MKIYKKEHAFELMVLNCCSLVSANKQAEFHALVDEANPDIICETESILMGLFLEVKFFPMGTKFSEKTGIYMVEEFLLR